MVAAACGSPRLIPSWVWSSVVSVGSSSSSRKIPIAVIRPTMTSTPTYVARARTSPTQPGQPRRRAQVVIGATRIATSTDSRSIVTIPDAR